MRWTAFLLLIGLAACGRHDAVRPGEQLSGLYLIHQNGRSGYVDGHGNIKIPPQYEQAAPFSDGLAVVAIGGRAGYIDTSGKVVISPQFDSGAPFSEGLAAVRLGNGWGFINKDGKMVIPARYQDPGRAPMQFSGGLAPVATGPGARVGYIDRSGRMVIPPQFDSAAAFSDGLAKVWIGGRYGYVDTRGKLVINPQFDQGEDFYEDRAAVRIGPKSTGPAAFPTASPLWKRAVASVSWTRAARWQSVRSSTPPTISRVAVLQCAWAIAGATSIKRGRW
jgi:hypothetical protein